MKSKIVVETVALIVLIFALIVTFQLFWGIATGSGKRI
jgi:hypothetical protein